MSGSDQILEVLILDKYSVHQKLLQSLFVWEIDVINADINGNFFLLVCIFRHQKLVNDLFYVMLVDFVGHCFVYVEKIRVD